MMAFWEWLLVLVMRVQGTLPYPHKIRGRYWDTQYGRQRIWSPTKCIRIGGNPTEYIRICGSSTECNRVGGSPTECSRILGSLISPNLGCESPLY